MGSLSDIVAQMRGRGEDGRMDRRLWLDYADRIEAAWKRERVEVRMTASTTILKERVPVAVGNAAAMYEALVKIAHYCDDQNGMDDPYCADGHILSDIARAALSAPVRNCDRFADELDAQLAFLNEVWLISVDRETMLERDKYENWTDEMRNRYGRWLLAPAAERKGESDGR